MVLSRMPGEPLRAAEWGIPCPPPSTRPSQRGAPPAQSVGPGQVRLALETGPRWPSAPAVQFLPLKDGKWARAGAHGHHQTDARVSPAPPAPARRGLTSTPGSLQPRARIPAQATPVRSTHRAEMASERRVASGHRAPQGPRFHQRQSQNSGPATPQPGPSALAPSCPSPASRPHGHPVP